MGKQVIDGLKGQIADQKHEKELVREELLTRNQLSERRREHSHPHRLNESGND
jgi:hypothetical protein